VTTLAGKVALVTGGASGIGEATVRRLVEEGATVAIVDTNDVRGAALARELGGRFVRADVAEPADWRRAVDDVCNSLGGLDLAHLNAGTSIAQPDIAALSDDDYRRIMRANVDGVVFGMRAVVPAIAARGGGAVVVTASLAGLIPIAFDPVYALTKHGVVGLVRSLAPALAEQRITVNCVCPGLTDTPLISGARDRLEAVGFPLIPPSDIAAAVVACMAGDASGEAYVCQAGRPPVAFEFHGVPGPRGGVRPPEGLRGVDV
jgi:NAD(P)-dependent dehydrogenase (short-subunit alcohol dehydrogenase family)